MYLSLVGWHQPAAISILQLLPPSQWDRGENRKIKIWILVAWDSLISKVWGMGNTQKKNQNKWCKGNHSPLLTSRLMTSQCLSNGYLPQKTFPSHLLLSMTWYDVECAFGHLGSAVQTVSLPSLLPTPTYLLWGKARRKGKPGWCASTAQQ